MSIQNRILCVLLLALSPLLQAAPPAYYNLTPALLPEKPEWGGNHPRVVMTPEMKERVLKRIKSNPEVAEMWAMVKASCDAYTNPKDSKYLDETKAYDDYLSMQGGTHKKQGALEGTVRRWLIPLDTLIFGYAVTGDEKYGKKAAAMVVATAKKLNPTLMEAGFFYTTTFPTRTMALGLDWCYPMFTSEERQIVRQSLATFVNAQYLRSIGDLWGQTTLGRIWNWNPGIASAWGLGALVLDGETNFPTRQWAFQAARNVEDFLRYAVDGQGGLVEGPAYFGYGAGYTPYFVEAFRQYAGEDLYQTTHYNRLAKWLPLEALPTGRRINNILDSSYKFGVSEAHLYAIYREADRPLARYLWEQFFLRDGLTASLPAAILWSPDILPASEVSSKAATFPDYGWSSGRSIVISRSGKGTEDAYFTIHAQHYTLIKHDQADKGQFTFYAYGDDLAIDSGYANDNDKEKGTSGYAHNQVLVDGKPEVLVGYHAQSDGWIVDSLHAPLVDLSVLDIGDAYRFYYKSQGSSAAYTKDFVQNFEKADRLSLFVRKPFPYAIVFDDMKKDSEVHDYSWLLHIRSGKAFEKADGGIRVIPEPAEAVPVVIHPLTVKDDGLPQDQNAKTGIWQVTAQVPTAGKYTVWGLTGTENPDGMKSDSFFLSINGGRQGFPATGSNPQDRFVWLTHGKIPLNWVPLNDGNGSVEVPALQFNAGAVEFKLISRELGAACAAIALVPESAGKIGKELPSGTIVAWAKDGQVTGSMKRMQIEPPKHGGWLQVRFITPTKWEEKVDSFLTTTEGSHPRLSVTTKGIVRGQFLTFLVPHPIDKGKKLAPASTIEELSAKKGSAGRLVVDKNISDVVACWDGTGIEVGDIQTDANLLWLRRDNSGKILAASAANASYLAVGGKKVFASATGKTSFTLSDGKAFIHEGESVKFDLGGVKVETVKRATENNWMAQRPASEK